MFDIIYLDGNHSIYVDLAAAIAAVRLLSLAPIFLFDERDSASEAEI
ncbi:hypothetical protein IVA95_27820 [Bradyrhizobium sp. 157]|nr:hypothetical protein [Bradyrhizobium sp. 157]MCK1641287.1 hypothetical protein [Bradyrhizobium sp. 157]